MFLYQSIRNSLSTQIQISATTYQFNVVFQGVGNNKIMRMGLMNGDHIKTWRYSTMKAWNVNWETRHMMIQFEDDKNVIFQCLSADCKVIHEFIGGYIFLSMRSKESNQQLNEELFHKLTGGWA